MMDNVKLMLESIEQNYSKNKNPEKFFWLINKFNESCKVFVFRKLQISLETKEKLLNELFLTVSLFKKKFFKIPKHESKIVEKSIRTEIPLSFRCEKCGCRTNPLIYSLFLQKWICFDCRKPKDVRIPKKKNVKPKCEICGKAKRNFVKENGLKICVECSKRKKRDDKS